MASILVLAGFGGEAFAFTDGFDYPTGAPVPSPWIWSRSGSSSNVIEFDGSQSNRLLHSHYSGSGWLSISRNDPAIAQTYQPGGGAIYTINFFDDGSKNIGLLFKVGGPNGWVGIGVNNNVAPGKYYFRTNQSSGNTGTVIPVARNSAAANNNWHTFQIYVRDDGAYPLVDGVPISNIFRYAPLTQADTVELQIDWSKPAWDGFFDNFSVNELGPCPYLTCWNYQIQSRGSVYALNYVKDVLRWNVDWIDNDIQHALNGWARTSYTATPADLIDPLPGVDKDLIINYTCGNVYRGFAYMPAEAMNHTSPQLDCVNKGPARWGKINVTSAIYAQNVGAPTSVAWPRPGSGSSHDGIAASCNGFGVCDYYIEYGMWGSDPARGKDKDLSVTWSCSESSIINTRYIPAEANHHSIHLTCD